MSVETEITRLRTNRNTIRTKLIDLGLADTTSNLDDLANAIDGIVNRGAVQVEILEGTSYTIPAGYHNGSGKVSAMTDTAGEAEKYKLQAKTVTPTKNQQAVTNDVGYYGLSSVTVNAIPPEFQNVSSVTAVATDVLATKVIVTKDGKVTTGTMPNNGAVAKTLTTATKSYTVPAGYHNGKGTVSITTESKSVTPTEAEQTISPSTNKLLESVVVAPIPAEYIVTTEAEDVAAVAANILDSKVAYVNGERIEGSMPNKGAVTATLDTTTTSYTVPAGYHNGSGVVKITLETKTATPTKTAQNITATAGKVLSSVTVNPIPSEYIITNVEAQDGRAVEAKYMLEGYAAYVNGELVRGTMPNHAGSSSPTSPIILAADNTSYAISTGYYDNGMVAIQPETRTVTPTKALQNVLPAEGKVLSKVTVNAIPAQYITTTDANAAEGEILLGKTAYVKGAKVTGTMANNGAIAATIDGLSVTSYAVPAGYTSGGTVSLTNDIETALAAI